MEHLFAPVIAGCHFGGIFLLDLDTWWLQYLIFFVHLPRSNTITGSLCLIISYFSISPFANTGFVRFIYVTLRFSEDICIYGYVHCTSFCSASILWPLAVEKVTTILKAQPPISKAFTCSLTCPFRTLISLKLLHSFNCRHLDPVGGGAQSTVLTESSILGWVLAFTRWQQHHDDCIAFKMFRCKAFQMMAPLQCVASIVHMYLMLLRTMKMSHLCMKFWVKYVPLCHVQSILQLLNLFQKWRVFFSGCVHGATPQHSCLECRCRECHLFSNIQNRTARKHFIS